MPGRITPPIPVKDGPQWAINALTRVPVSDPGAGWTTRPAGLLSTSKCLSSKSMSNAIFSALGNALIGGGSVSKYFEPGLTDADGSVRVRPSSLSCPARIRALTLLRDKGWLGVAKWTVKNRSIRSAGLSSAASTV